MMVIVEKMKNKQMRNAIKEARTGYFGKRTGYDMDFSECKELVGISDRYPYEATAAAFDYGFMKGVRFAKAMMEKGESF